MPLLPKILLKWCEPKDFTRLRYREGRKKGVWWQKVIDSIILGMVCMLFWSIAHFIPSKDPVGVELAIILSLLLSLFVFYFLPWVFHYFPSEIKMTKEGIVPSGDRLRVWSDIDSLEFSEIWGFPTIIMKLSNGREYIMAYEDEHLDFKSVFDQVGFTRVIEPVVLSKLDKYEI